MRRRVGLVTPGVWESGGALGGVVRTVLLPAAVLYGGVVAVRNTAFRVGLLRARSVSARVVSVGNVRVGGSGKTPVVRWLAAALRARGAEVAIVSRGYGGSETAAHVVGDGVGVTSDVARSGDEAVMLARTAGVPVVAGRDRAAAARLAIERFGAEIMVCDDAFQHRWLRRDVDVVLVDPHERGGVGRLLPAGPLREPLAALRRADVVVVVERDGDDARHRGVADEPATLGAGGGALMVRARLAPTALVTSEPAGWTESGLRELAGRSVAVVTGVARPAALWDSLREWEARLVHVLDYPDHHAYGTADWKQIAGAAKDVDLVVTTEKDLVKLERFPFARGKLVAVRLGVTIDNADALLARVLGQT